jgi:hypothetical protein
MDIVTDRTCDGVYAKLLFAREILVYVGTFGLLLRI